MAWFEFLSTFLYLLSLNPYNPEALNIGIPLSVHPNSGQRPFFGMPGAAASKLLIFSVPEILVWHCGKLYCGKRPQQRQSSAPPQIAVHVLHISG